MERNANYALVGLISTILLIAMIVFLFWLANVAFSQRYDTYDVVFHGAVTGLTRGGDVQFNGIKVGEVSDIKLDASDPNIVHAAARVRSDTPVRVDSAASLEPQGITGVNYIQITAGTTAKPLLKDATPAGKPLVIQAAPGAISSLLSGGGTMVQKALETLNRINQVLSNQNIQKFTAIMSDVQAVTAELRERKAIIADADKALQDADAAAIQIKELAANTKGLVDSDGKRAVVKVGDAANEIQGAAADVRVMINKLQGPTSDFATNGLPQLTSAINTLETATKHLDALISEIQRDPRAFINKPTAKTVEVKP
ncbi:MAG TPA: MlaD family protein [Caulobacteraceae bacterium]|jgi:phospholipid/cholesterol/gamma-HCH transport system substrate-binding protein|nr:MlaD family protein [Caulobacteraceae bacterium]